MRHLSHIVVRPAFDRARKPPAFLDSTVVLPEIRHFLRIADKLPREHKLDPAAEEFRRQKIDHR
jgi:hypothetical protein